MPPITTLTPYTVTVVLITLLVAVLTQVANSGKLLGKFTVSPTAMVWLLMVLPFLAAAGTTLQAAGTLTSVSVFNAVVAGIVAVVSGATPGLAVHAALHAHLVVPKLAASFRKPPSNNNAQAAPAKAA